ncbi:MAG: hypothetical protein JNM56_33110 [Planctomycetia bacterium]|nr:hypothetical protein [Planctomycetia bacterium]
MAPEIELLLGLVCVLVAAAPFALIYYMVRSDDSRPPPWFEETNDTWLSRIVDAVYPEREPEFDQSPPRPPTPWPPVVRELAEAYTNGADCAFALHDALIDAGFGHVAVEFSEEDFARDGDVIRRILR